MSTQISDKFSAWQAECEARFQQLKANEEELNRIFIGIYGLQDELTPEVADKDVTVHRIFRTKDDVPESMKGSAYVRTLRDEIVSLLSYAVGCMFGRYSLDAEGLAYAGGEWDASRYKTFLPDADNCIPVTDEEYFPDDVVGRLVEFVRVVYGADTLEENLDFTIRRFLTVFTATFPGGKSRSSVRTASPTTMASLPIISQNFCGSFVKNHSVMRWTSISNSAATSTSAIRSPCAR